MDNKMQDINIEEIMKEIRNNIQKRGYSDEILNFDEVDIKISDDAAEEFRIELFRDYLQQANIGCEVSYYTPIAKRGLKNFVKRAIRKLLAFLMFPMLQQQNAFNVSVTRSLNCIQKYIEADLQSDCHSRKVIDSEQKEKFFDYHEKLVEKLETKIMLLEQKVDILEKQLEDKNI